MGGLVAATGGFGHHGRGGAIEDHADGRAEFHGSRRFDVLRRIGAGGMGVVYEALDRERDARVALKMLRRVNADAVRRFKNEFRALQGLEHPNLVSLGELIAEEGRWFLSMELIDGSDFLSWVRPLEVGVVGTAEQDTDLAAARTATPSDPAESPMMIGERVVGKRLDEARLRDGLSQLVLGLSTLHAHGMVHRDIKPSNILVTSDGRVVLLDFGLVTVFGGSGDDRVVGTAAYMAPEQAASLSVGPEADWYGVGVMLYEALTGRLPYVGSRIAVLTEKQASPPPRPRELAPATPEDLDRLCTDLLAIEPSARPSAAGLLARLAIEDEVGDLATGSLHPLPFVGRDAELAVLDDALRAVKAGEPQVLFVEGESGVGKSALVKCFVDRAGIDEARTLSGRCYENESVPYKAVDGVVDALAAHLSLLPDERCEQLLPEHVHLLAKLFPVLSGVTGIASLPAAAESLDAHEVRTRAFSALRQLLARIGDEAPLIVSIDDLQWADADSMALLRELLAPPDAPVLLLVATLRPGAELVDPPGTRRLCLEPLPPADAEALARALAEASGGRELDVAAIAAEAGGHPMFIDELVRHMSAEGSTPSSRRLDDAISARIERLDDSARGLVEICSVHGGPLAQGVAARATECELAALGAHVRKLRIASLVRSSGALGTDTVEPYHDRIREAVVAHMEPKSRASCHS